MTRDDGGVRKDDGGMTRDDGGVRKDDGGMTRNDGGVRKDDGGMTRDDGGVTEKSRSFLRKQESMPAVRVNVGNAGIHARCQSECEDRFSMNNDEDKRL